MLIGFNVFGEKPRIDDKGLCNVAYMATAAYDFMVAMGSSTTPAHWLTLLGPPATGKTMLAKLCRRYFSQHLDCFTDERFDPAKERRIRRCIYMPWVEAVRMMLEGNYRFLTDMREAWLVIIDDIGTEYQKNRELSTSKLFEVLNAREGLWTIITANLTVQQIAEQMDARIASRLLRGGSVVIDVDAIDYNLRQ